MILIFCVVVILGIWVFLEYNKQFKVGIILDSDNILRVGFTKDPLNIMVNEMNSINNKLNKILKIIEREEIGEM